jgi:hypothetical protein
MATQARSNIAVSNDCTSNVFTPNIKIAINDVDRTSACQVASLRIILNRNEQQDSAEFEVNRDEGFTPTAGQLVEIGLGDSENLIFGGQIVSLKYVRERSGDAPRFSVSCRDWTALFNRRRITADFSGQSATDISTTIVENYTSGFFTYGIKSGMATIDEFICINETPLAALRRIANLMGGGVDIGPTRIVHVWDSAGPSSYYSPSNPATLTNSLHSLKAFVPEYDVSQWRSRVIVEGKSDSLPVAIPAGTDLSFAGPTVDGVPLTDEGGSLFNLSTHSSNYVRIGTLVASYSLMLARVGPPAALVSAQADPGDTSISLSGLGTMTFGQYGWFKDSAGNYFYSGAWGGGPPYSLDNIPASGFGSIIATIPNGAPVYAAHWLFDVIAQTASGAVETDIGKGESVIVRAHVDDASAQTAIAALEGGDGIHEHFVSDGHVTYVGCQERANNELSTFSDTLLRAEWVTHDMQTVPGTLQVINLSSPSALSATLLVDSVSLEFHTDNTLIASSPTSPCDSNLWPRRRVIGSTVKIATFFDAVVSG